MPRNSIASYVECDSVFGVVMVFIVKEATAKEAELVREARRYAPYGLSEPVCYLEDLTLGVSVFPLGGRGGTPKVTGEPPDYFAIFNGDNNMSIYGLRLVDSEMVGENGEECLVYNIESAYPGKVVDFGILGEAVLVFERYLTESVGYRSRVVGVRLVKDI